MIPALFLDRDGVIIENRDHYVRSWTDVAFVPGALEALAKIRSSQSKIVIVTNQSAIGRRILTQSAAEEINQKMCQTIQQAGGRIDAVYMCPHSPVDRCNCRKPNPGLLFHAARDLSIDLSQSILIGDAQSDLLAGQNAGLRLSILLLTGRGKDQVALPMPPSMKPFPVYNSLSEAIEKISQILLPPLP